MTKKKKSAGPGSGIFSRNKADFKDDAAAFRDIISENPPHEEGEFDYIDQHTEKQFRWQQVPVPVVKELQAKVSIALPEAVAEGLAIAVKAVTPEMMIADIENDLRESINSDVESISRHAKKAAQAIGEATVARAKRDIDDAAYRAILESYWRANRSRIARLADQSAGNFLINSIRAVMRLYTGLAGGVSSLAALKVE